MLKVARLVVGMALFLPMAMNGAELFGLETKTDPEPHLKALSKVLVPGLSKMKIGMKMKDLQVLRKEDSVDSDPLLTPFSLVEMSDGDYALERTAFQYDEDTGLVTGLWLRNERDTVTREQAFELTKALYRIFGKPNATFEIEARKERGMIWEVEGKHRIILQFRADDELWPSVDFYVNNDFSKEYAAMMKAGEKEVPKDFLKYLNGTLDKTFPSP